MNLPFELDRIITIAAPRDVVFRFFTDNDRWASWWGAGSTIEPRKSGRVHIVHPNRVEFSGEVLDITPPESIVFTYGNVGGSPIPEGGSRVTIRLEDHVGGTRLHLTHAFSETSDRDHYVQGWRFQLSLFSNAVLNSLHANPDAIVDDWFALWADTDAASRDKTLARVVAPDVRFRDRFSALEGVEEVAAHITAAQRFMPGITLKRRGAARHCQGTVIADWDAAAADGSPRGSGTNVFVLDPHGRVSSATGFWSM